MIHHTPNPTAPAAGDEFDPADLPGRPSLTNMRLCMTAMLKCHDAPLGVPRMGLFYGPSGYGKSFGAAYVAAYLDAAYVVAEQVWTRRAMLDAIARELGLPDTNKTASRIFAQIVEHLHAYPRPILIDEVDYIVDYDWVEVIRDIHDKTNVAILLIGEESLPAKLMKRERFHNRLLAVMPAQPATVQDAMLLRDAYCRHVRIADDLVLAILEAQRGITRRVVVDLQAAQGEAISAGLDYFDRAAWGERPFSTGKVQPRKMVRS